MTDKEEHNRHDHSTAACQKHISLFKIGMDRAINAAIEKHHTIGTNGKSFRVFLLEYICVSHSIIFVSIHKNGFIYGCLLIMIYI